MQKDVVCVGELLIDLTQVEPRGHVPRYAANPGGAPANVAVAVQRLGAATAFIGCVGADAFGDQLRCALAEEGIDISALRTEHKVPTTLAVVSILAEGERSFCFYRSPGADLCLTREDIPDALLKSCGILHYGSLSLTEEPARSAVLDAVAYAKTQGAVISFDPNYRAPLWPDQTTAVRWMQRGCIPADIIKVSEEEAELLTGEPDVKSAAWALAASGAKLVLVTLGAGGVWYHCKAGTGQIPAFSVPVADTNGAGDAFLGAVLSRLALRESPLKGLSVPELEDILRFACAAAALTVSKSGAIPAIPTKKAVQEFLTKVKIPLL